jgi:hypothetical protein
MAKNGAHSVPQRPPRRPFPVPSNPQYRGTLAEHFGELEGKVKKKARNNDKNYASAQ